jgi:hypothetical protein
MGAGRLLQQPVSSSAFQMQDTVQQQQQQCVSYSNLEDFSSKVEIYKGRCAGIPRKASCRARHPADGSTAASHDSTSATNQNSKTQQQNSSNCFCDNW